MVDDNNRSRFFTVARYFALFGLQPHLSKSFKLSTDPFFVEKGATWSGSISIRRMLRRYRGHLCNFNSVRNMHAEVVACRALSVRGFYFRDAILRARAAADSFRLWSRWFITVTVK